MSPGRLTVDVTVMPPGRPPDEFIRLGRVVEAPADRHLLLDFAIGAVRGRAYGPDGLPLPGAGVSLEPVDGLAPANRLLYLRTDGDGRFHFPAVQQGAYLLQLHGGQDHAALAATPVAVPGDGEVEVELAVPEGGVGSGR